ncbi:MAG: tRNA lysidine(34) synthetase TilS [Deltaproteobacteria bacterium]|nr:tRNA lysidine(34) synthetase TilS [Deltaproteobacteria bacterium]
MTFQHDYFLSKVSRTIATYNMFAPGDSVLVGVSGGADSTALLYTLIDLSAELSLTLAVAHFNHEIRKEEADKEAAFVQFLAEKLALPFYIKNENVLSFRKQNRLSLEEAARKLRYRFYFNVAEKKGFNKIALGHHSDDNAEQVLMNLIRGSGLKGLSGIPAIRQNMIVRPLIHSSRKEIEKFIQKRDLRHVLDASNQDSRYLRNRIRNSLLPILEESYNPGIKENLNRLSNIITDEEDWISTFVETEFKKNVVVAKDKSLLFAVSWIEGIHLALKRRILRHAIQIIKGDLRRIEFGHIDAAEELVSCKSGCKSIDLPDGLRVERSDGFVKILKCYNKSRRGRADCAKAEAAPFNYIFFKTGFKPGVFHIKETGAKLSFSVVDSGSEFNVYSSNSGIAFMDMDRVYFPVIVRSIRPGDRFTPLGMTGSQKVKNFFINNKVPRHRRLLCPVLVSRKRIIWLAGYRITDSAKVTSETVKILKIELLLAK